MPSPLPFNAPCAGPSVQGTRRCYTLADDKVPQAGPAVPEKCIGHALPLASLGLLILEAPRIALIAAAFALLTAATAVAAGAVACLVPRRQLPAGDGAPLLVALLPAWLVASLLPQPAGVAALALPATAVLAGLTAGLAAVMRLTKVGLVGRAAGIDGAAATAIGLPLRQAGWPLLAMAVLASLIGGAAVAAALPGDIAWLAVAAPAALVARGAIATGLAAAVIGGAAGTGAVFGLQQPPAALAVTLLLAAAVSGGLRSIMTVRR